MDDADIVVCLKRTGAIVIGKTNLRPRSCATRKLNRSRGDSSFVCVRI